MAPSLGGLVAKLPIHEGDGVHAAQLLVELWHEDLDAELALAASERERATSALREVDVIAARIRRLVATAPFAGIVAEVNGEVGEYATPSPTGIPKPRVVDRIDVAPPYVLAPIDEVDAPRVHLGLPVRITLDALGRRSFPGRVQRIAPYGLDREKQARTVAVEVAFVDSPAVGELLPGYSAGVEIVSRASTTCWRWRPRCCTWWCRRRRWRSPVGTWHSPKACRC